MWHNSTDAYLRFENISMNKIRFYIFGTPDGFDIYQEAPDANIKSYYQCFYDESIKENTRLAVHRKVNGEVSYTFLKYHLFSSGNRSNAFIGLSVVFSKEYYFDVSSLYNLLEHAYNSILERGILLKTIADGNSAKFETEKFTDKREEVKRIESFILNTLNSKEYSIDFTTLDNTFEAGKQNVIFKIPFQIYDDETKERSLNQSVLDSLRKYSWLSLSPDYIKPADQQSEKNTLTQTGKDEIDEELDPITKAQYINSFETYQSEVLASFEQLVNKADDRLIARVNILDKEVGEILNLLSKYCKTQNDLQDLLRKYSDLSEKIDTLKGKLHQKTFEQKREAQNKTNAGNIKSSEHEKEHEEKKRQLYLVAGGVFALVFILSFILSPNIFTPAENGSSNDTTATTDTTTTDTANEEHESDLKIKVDNLVKDFRSALDNNDFETAVTHYKGIVDAGLNHKDKLNKNLDEKFQSLISSDDFGSAHNFYSNIKDSISAFYNHIDMHDELIDSFKQYVKNNINNPNKRNELIQQIQQAKTNNYAYVGIDEDLRALNESPAYAEQPKPYTLTVKCENSEREMNSSEIIEIEVTKIYYITNKNSMDNAKFSIYEKDKEGVEFISLGKQECSVKVSSDRIGDTIYIHYTKGDIENKIFTIQLKVIQ